jgi:hypothetical protein
MKKAIDEHIVCLSVQNKTHIRHESKVMMDHKTHSGTQDPNITCIH